MRSPRVPYVAGLVIGMLATTAAGVIAQEGATITVAQDGSADFDTIGTAIEAAADGDTILVGPGTYAESLFIDKAITLAGDGPRDQVVIAPEPDAPNRQIEFEDPGPVAIYVDGADVIIEHLTITIPWQFPIALVGGTSVVRDIVTDDTLVVRGDAAVVIEDSDLHSAGLAGPNETVLRNNTIREAVWVVEGAHATAEGNLVLDYPAVADAGGSLELSGNTFRPLDDEPAIVIVDPESTGRVIGNDIEGGWAGILLEYSGKSLVEGNTIDGAEIGIVVVESTSTVRDNTVTGVGETGIEIVGEGPLIEGNTVEGGRIGIQAKPVPGDLHPRAPDLVTGPFIEGNTITGASHFGLVVDRLGASVSGNTICAGREPLKIVGDADPEIGTNEICEVD